jgi:PPM family protein phosphatase
MAVAFVRERLEAARPQLEALAALTAAQRCGEVEKLLQRIVHGVHLAVCDRARRELDKRGMGTTLEVGVIVGPDLYVAHVGDSRTYVIRDGQTTLLTRDHTMAQVMVNTGTPVDDIRQSPMRSVLLNAIGVGIAVTIDIVHQELRCGDRVLLCSDGLYEHFRVQEVAERLPAGSASDLAALVALANSRGGHDNITGVLVAVTSMRHPNTVPRSPATPPPIPASRLPRPIPRVPTPAAPARDVWDDETTMPRSSVDMRPVAHPLAGISEGALFSMVESALNDDSGSLVSLA